MRSLLFVVACLAAGSCASQSSSPTTAPAAAAVSTTPTHENLNSVLWMQTAVEYEAAAAQAYRLASLQLDTALKNPSWTAALEQTGDVSKLPPAVILDIDETVLDNSYFQARLVRDRAAYSEEGWSRWVQEARATPIPGAVEFTKRAAAAGVKVFFVTNRTAAAEAPTRANLQAHGFPLAADVDTVLARGERPEWQASAKGPRRAYVAREYRILLLIGDDLGDFVVNASGTVDERRQRTAPNASWWGERWIMIPNPTYGSWERAVIGNATDSIDAKRRALRYEPR
jgi:5'-nucleotidase (lipoprotein e(P4) family)